MYPDKKVVLVTSFDKMLACIRIQKGGTQHWWTAGTHNDTKAVYDKACCVTMSPCTIHRRQWNGMQIALVSSTQSMLRYHVTCTVHRRQRNNIQKHWYQALIKLAVLPCYMHRSQKAVKQGMQIAPVSSTDKACHVTMSPPFTVHRRQWNRAYRSIGIQHW